MIRGYASAPALFCGFRGGEFSNMKAIVDCADVVDLKLDDTFLGTLRRVASPWILPGAQPADGP
ncbi:hypothetical protein Y900_027025 [Mycolicibacterium aromaticivorans JS19b1 = JCM 16368]|uniref:Uncharacterized protein n=1 Tax=Mycolicibacterium aromaticivorans JS19b1 = JCM 16368 TaxID=1440774 RepID=A0A064CE10_9MYCO|nr:hypothetical protein [Mycolicibacterium aromaticivorans]KDE96963.1 hypothetical protein Y900_027025 [Mycolicibacterium aromaticivorans JS19b1 = JCM 16368]